MSAVELIALASTVSLLAGWRLYLVTFAVGLAMKLGWVALPDQLRALLTEVQQSLPPLWADPSIAPAQRKY